VADIVRAEGLTVKEAHTNSIAARIAVVDGFLTKMVDGEPGILFDPVHNEELIQAMAGKYRYKINTSGQMEDKPDKVRPFADLADGLQYGCLFADAGATFGRTLHSGDIRRDVKQAASRGWT
jgi:hypothetical protein